MGINVRSEVGRLKKVMLHRPGKELEQLIPTELGRLLFDDIPYLKTAQKEHDAFARLLADNGAEVVYLEDLMAQTLHQHPEIKKQFISQFIDEGGEYAVHEKARLMEYFTAIEDERTLVDKTMAGVLYKEIGSGSDAPLTNMIKSRSRCVLDPIPNLYFTRDPFASVGRGVCVNHMFTKTRRRETIYGDYIIRYHDDFAGKVFHYYNREDLFSIEGGDILNLSSDVIAVGISQRTSPEAIELLARRIFANEDSPIRTILALDIPALRAYMHLDTVMTMVDVDKFTVFPGILGGLRIYTITPESGAASENMSDFGQKLQKMPPAVSSVCSGKSYESTTGPSTEYGGPDFADFNGRQIGIFDGGLSEDKVRLHVEEEQLPLAYVLKKYLHLDHVKLIYCGGRDGIASEREQWNDGSNTLCIAPGKVVVYDRNNITNRILVDEGIEVLEIESSELSRGRGGPRCMSMPLEREDL